MPDPWGPVVASVRLVDPDADAVSIAEALWLAAHRRSAPASDGTSPDGHELLPGTPRRPPRPATEPAPVRPWGSAGGAGRPLFDMIPGGAGDSAARRIGIGRAHALPRALELARALRPFKTPWPAGRRQDLDVDATVRGYAETGELIPAFRPSPEQWFDAALVVDGAPGMAVWDDVATEFRRLLRQTGAFRTIRSFELVVDGDEPALRNTAGARLAARQLCAADARRIVFVLSDCAASDWQRPFVWQTLRVWSESTPTVLVNPLSAKLWNHAGLDLPASQVRARAPGCRNKALAFRLPPLMRILHDDRERWLPLPVVGLTPYSLGRYAATLMRGSTAGCEAVLLSAEGRLADDDWPAPPDDRPAADALVTAFRRLASPAANRLAVLASTCDRLTLPMLRLIAAQGVPEADVADVGETIAGGLVAVTVEQEIPMLTFQPGVRERLQERLRADDVLYVYDLLSRHAEDRVSSTDRFPVLVPAADGDRTVAAGQLPFAVLSADALEVLGLAPAQLPPTEPMRDAPEPATTGGPSGARYRAGAGLDRELLARSSDILQEKRLQLSTLTVPPGRGWAPLTDQMAAALSPAADDLRNVLGKLEHVQSVLDELPPTTRANRVSAFNELYLKISQRVDDSLRSANQPEYLELLYVELTRRYFAALDCWNRDDEATPDAWEVLFKRAGDVTMSRLNAAILGVNAHLNHDLPLALLSTWQELGAPEDDLVHPDYLLINQIFYEEIPPLRRGYSSRWQIEIDEFVGPLDDWSQRILVGATRAHAWDQARRLWDLRNDPEDFERARQVMDRASALIGEWDIIGDRLVTGSGRTATPGLLRRLFGRS